MFKPSVTFRILSPFMQISNAALWERSANCHLMFPQSFSHACVSPVCEPEINIRMFSHVHENVCF